MNDPEQPVAPPRRTGTAARIVGAVSLVLGGLAVLFIVLGVVGMASTATPNMQGFNSGATVTVSQGGMSVYARSDSDRMSTVCMATDGSGPTTLERPTQEFMVDVAGSDFFEVARSPRDLAPGSYALSCGGTPQALYVGPAAPATTAAGLLGTPGLVSGVVLGFFGFGLGIIALLMRHGARRDATPAPTGAAQPGQASPYAPDSPTRAAPPPPPPGGSRSEPTQAIAYGRGYFDQGQGDEPEHDSPAGEDGREHGPPPPPA